MTEKRDRVWTTTEKHLIQIDRAVCQEKFNVAMVDSFLGKAALVSIFVICIATGSPSQKYRD